ncbi:unnamed protein product [Absidia cylindrospora]
MQRNLQLLTKNVTGIQSTPLIRTQQLPNASRMCLSMKTTYIRPFSGSPSAWLHSSSYLANTPSYNNLDDNKLNKVCWKCDQIASRASVRCPNQDCGVIQPAVPDLNYYELLSAGAGDDRFEFTYDVDEKALKRQFLKLQQVAHPDSFSNAAERERKYAEIQSSMLNKAYHTLRDPLARAQYMLALHGVEVNEAESLHNPELLMDVMEVREELEEANTNEDVELIKQENDGKR